MSRTTAPSTQGLQQQQHGNVGYGGGGDGGMLLGWMNPLSSLTQLSFKGRTTTSTTAFRRQQHQQQQRWHRRCPAEDGPTRGGRKGSTALEFCPGGGSDGGGGGGLGLRQQVRPFTWVH